MTNLSRRQAIGGAATVGLGVPLLAACGVGPDSSGPAKAGTVLTPTKGVPVGGALVLSDQRLIISQPTAGEFKAFSNICTHQRCPIRTIVGDEVVCDCHHSHFSLVDGHNTVGPNGSSAGSTPDLAEVAVKVKGTDVVMA